MIFSLLKDVLHFFWFYVCWVKLDCIINLILKILDFDIFLHWTLFPLFSLCNFLGWACTTNCLLWNSFILFRYFFSLAPVNLFHINRLWVNQIWEEKTLGIPSQPLFLLNFPYTFQCSQFPGFTFLVPQSIKTECFLMLASTFVLCELYLILATRPWRQNLFL